MRKRAAPSVEVEFATDPLCPWSWAMEPIVQAARKDLGVAVRSVQAGWLPGPAAKDAGAAKAEWADAAAKTRAAIDPAYWDRVGPRTSLVAAAAVKAAGFQGAGKGGAYLSAVRRAAFARGEDVSSFDVLAALGDEVGLRADVFRVDLGAGRFAVEDVVAALDPARPTSESVWWFGRRTMLRSWEALAADLRHAEAKAITSPALRIVRGAEEVVLRGLATEAQLREAIRSRA